jgi:hypothetical protein
MTDQVRSLRTFFLPNFFIALSRGVDVFVDFTRFPLMSIHPSAIVSGSNPTVHTFTCRIILRNKLFVLSRRGQRSTCTAEMSP